MSLAALRSKVASAKEEEEKLRNEKISSCFPSLPAWTDEDKATWMKHIILQLDKKAAKGKTNMHYFFSDAGAKEFHHSYESTPKKPTVPHGLWRTRPLSSAVDSSSDSMDFPGWMCEYELPGCLPGWFLFLQDVRINIHSKLASPDASLKAEAKQRLREIEKQVQRELKSYWITHSDISVFDTGTDLSQGFTFDWSPPPVQDESYEVKRAREIMEKYQKKLDGAVEELARAKKRSKTQY